ncbi:MAG: hypothetical protein Kow006_09630 [Gammaproteobacteria bacterium]
MSHKQVQRRIVSCLLLSVAIFLIDLQLPLGVAGGVPYVWVILLTLPLPDRRLVIGFALFTSALTVAGYFLSEPGTSPWMVVTNRALALFAIWVTLFLGLRQRRTQERLEESENRFEVLGDTVSFIIWRGDNEGHWQEVSGGWQRYSSNDAASDLIEWQDHLHPDERERIQKHYDSAVARGETIQLECRMRDRDGEYRWVLIQGAPCTQSGGKRIGYLGTVVDIDQRVRAEQRYRASEARYRAVTENLLIGIALCDRSGKILATNQMATKLFGYSTTELIGRSICSLLIEPTCSNSPRCMHKFNVDNLAENSSHETIGLRNDGSRFPLELSFTTFYEGGERHHIAAMRDTTRQQMAEAALNNFRSRQQHRDKMAAIGRLAAGLLHEIGNPLSAIVGLNQTARQTLANGSSGSDGKLLTCLEQIDENLERILRVTRDISEFAEITPQNRTLVDLNQLVERTCRLVEYENAGEDVPIHFFLDASLPALPLVPDHLIQMLLHLLHNAVEACHQTPGRSKIRVATMLDHDHAQIQIQDNGCGMPKEMLERARNAFFTNRTSGGGMGIGLALCHAVVAEYGGHLQFESAVGEGTTVTVSLPLAEQNQKQATATN